MHQDQYIIELSSLSKVSEDLIFRLTTITTYSSKELLIFYKKNRRFPTIEEIDQSCKFSNDLESTRLWWESQFSILTYREEFRLLSPEEFRNKVLGEWSPESKFEP